MKTLFLTLVAATAWWVAGEQTAQAGGRFSVGISITHVDHFYEPLRAHGHWVNLRSYGRCRYPAYVAADWRPYTEGHWEWTDQGWYWVSEEDWGWATYHYGRWVWDTYYGWVWVPDTEWAPAWVAWREGPDFVGWAPLPPRCDFGPRGVLVVERIVWAPTAFIFIEHRHMCRPVRQHAVVNQTIINQTVNITKIEKVENNITVINNGPATTVVEKRTGERVRENRAADLWRQRSEQVVERSRQARVQPPPVVTAPVPAVATTTTPAVQARDQNRDSDRGRGRDRDQDQDRDRDRRTFMPPTAVTTPAPATMPAAPTTTPPPPTTTRVEDRARGRDREQDENRERRSWTPPTVVRGPQRETETPRPVEPVAPVVKAPTTKTEHPPVVTERPENGRRQWTPPTVTRGPQREEEKPAPTERRREFTPPSSRTRVEEVPPTPPSVAPAERSPNPYGRGEERRGRDDSRNERGRRGESSGTETNAPYYPRGR